jgi:multisubunit Na+/H+ antiporter MnhC subunit
MSRSTLRFLGILIFTAVVVGLALAALTDLLD